MSSGPAVLDRLFEPLADRLADLAAARRHDQLLDVGYGTGGTTVAIACRMGTTAPCVGLDISEPMLSAARAGRHRGVTATFICANAQTYPFGPESFDLIVSRFGVMVLRRIRSRHSRTCGAPRRDGGERRMIVGRRPGGQPVHDRRLGAATSVPAAARTAARRAWTVRGRTISACAES
jgi:SAM-dependent methyltransferase